MSLLNTPLRLRPVYKDKIWGRQQWHPALPPAVPSDGKIGEIWVTDDASEFLHGPLKGRTLAEAAQKLGPELCGRNWKDVRFPILAKYILTDDWLSLQVHPDDKAAQAYGDGPVGKMEMWYFFDCPSGSELLFGLREGATLEKLQAAAGDGTLKNRMQTTHPRAGEAYMVEPGRVHAIGPGLVLFEVEQNCDLTYRMDDFGRVGQDGKPRPLHREKAFAVTRFDLPQPGPAPELRFPESFGERRYVVACPYFAVEQLTYEKEAAWRGNPDRVEILTILSGQGEFETGAGVVEAKLPFRTGETWLVPPEMPAAQLVPDKHCELLRYYVPDLEMDFIEPLRAHGVPEDVIRAAVYST